MKIINIAILALSIMATNAMADNYIIDKEGMHASIEFKISHLGYSWLKGRFNDFDGHFSYDKDKPETSKIEVTINTSSIDSNHAKRDKHLRDEDFLDTDKYPEAKFVSTSFKQNKDGTGILKGDFTFRGITKSIEIDINYIGEGDDPWGGYRIGFEGSTKITLADYGMTYNLGEEAKELELFFDIEGIKQASK
ncbi:MAG: YceI family protein [Thiomicrorhabdus sp.]|nr:YceI family protein [Thiomicrorhabdus sp.]